MPMHILIRDMSGHSAVIEFLGGKTRVYKHPGQVLTNAPSLDWQRHYASKFNYVKTNITHQRVDGELMSGSGFLGIPGDWTPPGRFSRMTQVLKHFPKCHTDAQALFLARQGLGIVDVNLGVNPSPTLWESISNLRAGDYYFRPLLKVLDSEKHVFTPVDYKINAWQKFNVKAISDGNQLPPHWLKARIQPTITVRHFIDMMEVKRDFRSDTPPSFDAQ